MNVLSAIGSAFSNAGKKISGAISRAKSDFDGYAENCLDNEEDFWAYSNLEDSFIEDFEESL